MNGSETTQQRYKEESTPQQQRAEQPAGASASSTAPHDQEVDNTSAQDVLDKRVIGLLDDAQLWWSMRKDLWGELIGLFAAERALAVHSMVKLVVAGTLAIMLLMLCVVLAETLLALGLIALGIPLPGTVALLLGMNGLILMFLINKLKELPVSLSFHETRAAFLNNKNPEEG